MATTLCILQEPLLSITPPYLNTYYTHVSSLLQRKQEERTSSSVDDNSEHSETETENDPQEKNQESKSLINAGL